MRYIREILSFFSLMALAWGTMTLILLFSGCTQSQAQSQMQAQNQLQPIMTFVELDTSREIECDEGRLFQIEASSDWRYVLFPDSVEQPKAPGTYVVRGNVEINDHGTFVVVTEYARYPK